MRRLVTHVHRPDAVVGVAVGLGLGYLALLLGFALAFAKPSGLGWGGFAIVCTVVLVITTAVAELLSRGRRPH